ncbi:MAG: thioredoxin family protein [Chloroflexaceae bacterium]|jgi:hypothetical protein|nr:thioredoxin family protein [Chloroflexaceae bacterium]
MKCLKIWCALLLSFGLAACGQAVPAAAPTPAETKLLPVVATSELVVGQNRIPIGILRNGTPLNDPNLTLKLRFFPMSGNEQGQMDGEYEAVYRAQGLPAGLYVAYPTFKQAGTWAMEVEIPQPGGPAQTSRQRIEVLEKPRAPGVGSQAIASKTLTARDMPDLKQLTSDTQPDPDFYQLSIADAMAAGKPFVVGFITPGFCQTAVCGPSIQVLKRLKEQHKGQINFIHVEVYPYPFGESFQAQRRVPAMDEWNLRTEPWFFLVDANGTIQARYEGGITYDELEPALKQLAAGEPVTQ